MSAATPLSTKEYERRRIFVESMKTMNQAEFIEIARILRKHGVPVSENRSGMYFDMAKLTDEAFEEILHFHDFVLQNNAELDKRDRQLKPVATK
jgi:hypothetical protein